MCWREEGRGEEGEFICVDGCTDCAKTRVREGQSMAENGMSENVGRSRDKPWDWERENRWEMSENGNLFVMRALYMVTSVRDSGDLIRRIFENCIDRFELG